MSESTKPDVIYLQVCDDDDEDQRFNEVAWCKDRIHDEDVKYIRADLVATLRLELETGHMRLAACGIVALANTRETAAETRKMLTEYRSASLGGVERAVDSEMQYREELAEAQKQNAMMREYLERLACLGNGDRHGNSVGNDIAIEALNKTQDLSGLVLCEAEPVAFTNDVELDYAHYERADKSGTSGAFWKDYSEDSDIPLYKARKAK